MVCNLTGYHQPTRHWIHLGPEYKEADFSSGSDGNVAKSRKSLITNLNATLSSQPHDEAGTRRLAFR